MRLKNKIMKILYGSPLEISINTKIRYAPVVTKLRWLKNLNKNLKVLEVGSGSKGITRFFKHQIIGVDLEFQDYKNKYLNEVQIYPNKKYPFKDNEFDVVVAVDVIEHIPRKERKRVLKEMLRVSKKYIMITCPFTISRWDKKVLVNWPKSSETYKNIKEHIDCGIPNSKEIEESFKGCRMNMIYGEHPAVAYYIKLMERNILGKVFARTALKMFIPILKLIKGKSRRYYFIDKCENPRI